MTTLLDKPLKRELRIDGRAYTVTLTTDGLKLVEKGHRIGQELRWRDLLSGDAALAAALSASVAAQQGPARRPAPPPTVTPRTRRPQ